MKNLILFNKPFGVISQFSQKDSKTTLAEFISTPKYYPAGRLDQDSEGLLLLTNDGRIQARIADPKHKLPKTYWVQVDGEISDAALNMLVDGVELKDGRTKPASVKRMLESPLPPRNPPIRYRASIPTSWIELTIREGKNRQVRRMTANVGFPTLRLYRYRIGSWCIGDLVIGAHRFDTWGR